VRRGRAALGRPDAAGPEAEFRRALHASDSEVTHARRKLRRKAGFIAALGSVSYAMLVFSDAGVVLRLLCAAALVVAIVATATGIMHDGNHGAFGRSRRLNRVLGFSGDLLGASSWLWRVKHNTLHHASPNVMGIDTDIEQMPFARLAPDQPWRPWHRAQHVYLWFLYGFMALSWLFVSDLRALVTGREGAHRLPRRPTPLELATIAAGKALHLGWAVVIPLLFCPWWGVLTFYLVCSWCVGFVLALMFQLAHCVDEAEFTPSAAAHRGPHFATHQLRSTVDITITTPVVGRFLRWWMGGLDHQVAHHLAPRLPHTIYPLLSRRVEQLCSSHGLAYRRHTTLASALGSHLRWLRLMGRRPTLTAGA
jgi:linoleoyl-CoA desaturase